ncbi:MAG: DNA glycosylase [Flavobacteriales bacterium]|nr:MAG: DNA glycosylase [Flavobacteriales bacterium]
MFIHRHPYPPFIPKNAEKLIIGTLPPPRFSVGELRANDVDFCYGSSDGQLWVILDKIFNLNLTYKNTPIAVTERKKFLIENKIGICDMVESCKREKPDATDLGMKDVKMRNLIGFLKKYSSINTLLFTGGLTKNGPGYFFKKHLQENGLKWTLTDNNTPKIHQFELDSRQIKAVSLTAPSGSANRAVGSFADYKLLKQQNSEFTTIDYRVMQYKRFFKA